jgi:hypothetical protein
MPRICIWARSTGRIGLPSKPRRSPTFRNACLSRYANHHCCDFFVNVAGLAHFDIYPFILLNLAFQSAGSLPSSADPAGTRWADRDKVHTEADAQHREDIARASAERQVAITTKKRFWSVCSTRTRSSPEASGPDREAGMPDD